MKMAFSPSGIREWARHITGRQVWFFSFFYTVAVAFLIQFILLPYVIPAWHAGNGLLVAGDWIGMHESAKALAEKIHQHGWSAWTLWPPPRGWIESCVAGTIYALTVSKPWVLIPFNAVFHATTALLFFRIFGLFTGGRKDTAALATLPFLFFPSSLLWNSQIHKDGAAILACSFFIYGWIACVPRKDRLVSTKEFLSGMASVLLGVGLIFFARPYLVQPFSIFSFLYGSIVGFLWIRTTLQKKLAPRTLGIFIASLSLTVFLVHSGPMALLRSISGLFSSDPNRVSSPINAMSSMVGEISIEPAPKPTGQVSLNVAVAPKLPAPEVIKPPEEPLLEQFEVANKLVKINLERIHIIYGHDLLKKTLKEDPHLLSLPYEPPPTVRQENKPIIYVVWEWNTSIPRFIEQKLMSIAAVRRGYLSYLEARSNIDTSVLFYNTKDMVLYLPRAVQIAFFAPFPPHWFERGSNASNTVFRRVVGLEMLLSYLLFPFFLFSIYNFYRRADFFIAGSFCTVFLVFYSTLAPNLGSLHRFRYGFTTLLLGFGVIGFALARERFSQRAKTAQTAAASLAHA